MSAHLYALAGPVNPPSIVDLSNFEAGVAFLGVINQLYPGIRFGQLPALAGLVDGETMGFSLSSLNPMKAVRAATHVIGDLKDGVGDVLKDTFTTVGDGAGAAVRLATDEKVLDGAMKAYTAYQTGGASGPLQEFINSLGSNVKSAAAKADAGGSSLPGGPLPWMLGGVGLLAVLLVRR